MNQAKRDGYRVHLANLSCWTRTGQGTIVADSATRVLEIARGRSGVHVKLPVYLTTFERRSPLSGRLLQLYPQVRTLWMAVPIVRT